MLNYEEWEFHNMPKPMQREDYEEVLEAVVEDLKANPAVEAAYLAGGEWIPGISDMDVIVLLNKEGKESDLKHPKSLSEKSRYIFMHGYGVYSYEALQKMFYLNPYTGEWKKLFGKDVKIGGYYDLSDMKEQRLFVAATIFDLLVNKLLYLPSALLTRRVDVRKTLGWLWSITYTLDMLEFVTGEAMAEGYRDSIKELRACWFKIDEQEALATLVDLIEEANSIIFKIAIRLGDYLSKRSKLVEPRKVGIPLKKLPFIKFQPIVCFMNYKNALVFGHERRYAEEYITFYLRDYRRRLRLAKFGSSQEFYLALLPWDLSAILYSYALDNGVLSNWIRKDLYTSAEAIPILDSVGIQRRIAVLNENLEDFKRNRLAKVPFPYGFTAQKATLKHSIGRAILKALSYISILSLQESDYG